MLRQRVATDARRARGRIGDEPRREREMRHRRRDTHVKAVVNDTVIAEAPVEDLIKIEGNWYFPPSSVKSELLETSPTPYTCPWKGECQYFTVNAGGQRLQDRAWSYPTPYPTAFDRVGKDFSNYVAFWKEVEVVD
jgi:uncharacterized protein (DUF427 family)